MDKERVLHEQAVDAIDGRQTSLHHGRPGGHRSRERSESALKRLRVRTASSKAQDLASLWVGGIETMLDVPGAGPSRWRRAAYPSPAPPRGELLPDGLRAIPAGGAAFAVTAFDPPGVERTRDENARENASSGPC